MAFSYADWDCANPDLYTPSAAHDVIEASPTHRLRRTVHGVVHPLVDTIDLLAVCLGIDINRRFISRKQVIKGGIEYANDFRAFVVDNSIELLVPQHRDRKSDHDVASSDE